MTHKFKYHYHNGRKVYDERKPEPTWLVKHDIGVTIGHPTQYRVRSISREDGSRRTITEWVELTSKVVLKRTLNGASVELDEEVRSVANGRMYRMADDGNLVWSCNL